MRIFGRSGQEDNDPSKTTAGARHDSDAGEEDDDKPVPKPKGTRVRTKTKQESVEEALSSRGQKNTGAGDAGGRRVKNVRTSESEETQPPVINPRRKNEKDKLEEEGPEEGIKPVKKHPRFKSQETLTDSEEEEEAPPENVSKSKSKKPQRKGDTAALPAKQAKESHRSRLAIKSQDTSGLELNDSVRFISRKDLGRLPKVEPGKGGHFLATSYSYRRPLKNLRLRVILAKYPTLADQDEWPGDLAVMDERIFMWQEKVFSQGEAKRYQRLENCTTEAEKRYNRQLREESECIGKHLYSYVDEDPYACRKKQKTLIRRCPVPHIRSSANKSNKFSVDALNSDGDSLDAPDKLDDDEYDDLSSGEDLDFDKPISSSTPKTSRKHDPKGDKDVTKKAEQKERAKKEKESKEAEKRSLKLQQLQEKKAKEDEKRRSLEEKKASEKMKKVEAMRDKDKEFDEECMRKYSYSRRPSLPVAARLRSGLLSPSSPRKGRKQERLGSSVSDFLQEERESDQSGGSRQGKTRGRVPLSQKPSEINIRTSRKVRNEFGNDGKLQDSTEDDSNQTRGPSSAVYLSSKGPSSLTAKTRRGSKTRWKLSERLNYRNSQTMFIMAAIPFMARKRRPIVVCVMRSIPQYGVLIFKPALGYRNVEVKRNHVYRISCELCSPSALKTNLGEAQSQYQLASQKSSSVRAKREVSDDFGPLFEMVSNNELRVTVMGEITTAEGFDSSPLCIYYIVDVPKGWRNGSVLSSIEGITHTCFSNDESVAHFSHEFSFQLVFSMDSIEEAESFPTPIIALMVVSMNHPSPRILHEGYGYIAIPMTPGSHFVKIRTWKLQPRTTQEKMKAAFLDITPSLQDIKCVHTPSSHEDNRKANLVGLQTEPSGNVSLRLHVIHQTKIFHKEYESRLDLLEKMSSATILRSVQAVIAAFQRARFKAVNLKNQYQ